MAEMQKNAHDRERKGVERNLRACSLNRCNPREKCLSYAQHRSFVSFRQSLLIATTLNQIVTKPY